MAEKKTAEAVEEIVPQEEKKVLVKIPFERGATEDVVVWVNDRRFLLKRGETVEVPECVAEVLERSERQQRKTYELQNRKADRDK